MFGGSGTNKGEQLVAPQAADDRFSLVELRRIYKQLVENKIVNSENQDLVIEILRVIAEMVVYGDNKSELLFDFFCEKSMLSLFLEIMHSEPVCPYPVHVQILQTLSILISCVKNDTSLYYLLSNNHINDILMFRHDFSSDESLSAQFASFMKTLSLRLNDQTVQFFFREDSGAFPILTKAVELLGSKDPMIRISAQSTILNIFRVNEQRAMAYALQEDNLYILLECIVGIMKEQFDALNSLSQAYLGALQQQSSHSQSLASGLASSSADVLSVTKIEQNMDDCIIAIEDWIYYLQDLYDLNIPQLQLSLSTHLLNAFIYPVLLESILALQLLISSEENSTTEPSDASASQASRIDISMYYLLQLGRIFPSQALRRAIFTALCHPVSQESRSVMAMHIHLHISSCTESKPSLLTLRDWSLPNDVQLKANLFQEGLRACLLQQSQVSTTLNQQYQKFATLTTYAMHGILQALFQDFKNADISLGALKLEVFLSTVGFLSNEPLIDLICTSKTLCKATLSGEEEISADHNHSGDFLSLAESMLLQRSLLKNSSSTAMIDTKAQIERFIFVVQHPQQFSIANLQAACQLLAYICHIVICAGDVSGISEATTATVNTSEASSNAAAQTNEGIETSASAKSPKINDNMKPQNNKFKITLTDRLETIAQALRLAMNNAASVLLARAESSFAEMLLILFREEIDRFQGRTWKELHAKIYSEKGLIFPHLSQSHSDVMGMDFVIPVSHVETMRKEVHIFLMLRAMLHYLATSLASFGDGKMLPFEFSTFLSDCAFLSLEDDSIVPPHLKSGSPFDMKSKKFLDSTVLVPNNNTATNNAMTGSGGISVEAVSSSVSSSSSGSKSPVIPRSSGGNINPSSSTNNNSNNGHSTNSSHNNNNSSSIFSFGLFGKSSSSNIISTHGHSSNSNNNKANNSNNANNTLLAGMSLGQKLLFVQDSQVLQLISATKVDGKSVFKVHIVAPLLYVDAKMDMHNKKRVKLVVRSYKSNIPGMYKMDLSFPSEDNNGNKSLNVNMSPGSPRSQSILGGHVMMSSSSGHNPAFLVSASNSNGNNGSNSPVPHSHHTHDNNIHNNLCGFRPAVFLKPVRKANMFEIDLLMDTEQAASLAMQHVENKRRQLQQLKIEECKKKMQYWLADQRHWSDCIPNSES